MHKLLFESPPADSVAKPSTAATKLGMGHVSAAHSSNRWAEGPLSFAAAICRVGRCVTAT